MHSIKDFFQTIYTGFSYVVRNFPIIFVGLVGLFLILYLNNHNYVKFDNYEQMAMISFGIISGCLSSLFITINNRSKKKSGLRDILGQVVSITVGLGIYRVWHKFGNQQVIQYSIMLCIGLLILKIFLGYHKAGKENENNIWYYYSTLIGHVIVAVIYGTTIMLGLLAIVKSVLYLFDIGSDNIWMADIAYFAYVIVAPFVFLSYTKFEAEGYNIHKFVQFFAKYVLVSLLIAYAGVLLVYVGKIIITQERPKGILIYMIYGFGAIGFTTLYILYPLRDTNLNYTKRQRIYGGLLVLFLIVGTLAISIRVKEYGITAPRYLVILLLIWFFYVGLCALFPKYFHIQRNIFVLWGLVFLGVFARPLNMYHTVLQSQLGIRESILAKNNILDQTNIVIPGDHKNTVSTGDIAKLSSVVDYITENYGPKVFAKYISGGVEDLEINYTGYQYDKLQEKRFVIMDKIGLYYDQMYRTNNSNEMFIVDNYYNYYAGENWEIDINGNKIYNFTHNWGGGTVYDDPSYDTVSDIFSIKIKDDLICSMSLKEIIQEVIGHLNIIDGMQIINKEGGEPIKIESDTCILWISGISLEKRNQDFYVIQYMNGLVYIK